MASAASKMHQSNLIGHFTQYSDVRRKQLDTKLHNSLSLRARRNLLRQRTDGVVNAVTTGTNLITVSESVRNLGVTIASTLLFNTHVNEVCKAVRHHTRALRHVNEVCKAVRHHTRALRHVNEVCKAVRHHTRRVDDCIRISLRFILSSHCLPHIYTANMNSVELQIT